MYSRLVESFLQDQISKTEVAYASIENCKYVCSSLWCSRIFLNKEIV